MKSTISHIKHSDESLTNRLHKVEDRISWVEDKVDKLEHSHKDKEKKLKVQIEHARPVGPH
jgi:GTP-binding protein EngB required for normal cell division